MSMSLNRRGFLKTGAAFAAAGAMPGTTGKAEAALQSDLKLGLVTYNLAKQWDVPTIINNCTETNYEGVELRSTHAHGVEPDISAAKRKEVKQRFNDSPVTLVSLGSACEYHKEPADVKKNIEDTKAFIRLAADLGAEAVKVRPNGCEMEGDQFHDPTLVQIGEALAECGEYGAERNVDIRVEVHGRNTQRAPAMERIMNVANHSHVNVCWNCNPTDHLEDGGFDANFDRLKYRIHFVHLKELSDPQYPYRRFFRRLKQVGYNGYCCMEVGKGSEDPIRFMEYYRELFYALQT
jgi:sugar phosphate isomerase/epimerase